jgi:hypothetical protein
MELSKDNLLEALAANYLANGISSEEFQLAVRMVGDVPEMLSGVTIQMFRAQGWITI